MIHKNVAVIITAAGFATRMGGLAKALLATGYETAIERICSTYEACGVHNIVVVLGKHSHLISPLLDHLKIQWVKNDNPERGMFSSIVTGLAHPVTEDCSFLIHPVDIPLISIDNIEAVINERFTFSTARCCSNYTDVAVLIAAPSMNKRRGHPPMFHPSLRSYFLSQDSDTFNLRDFQNSNLDRTRWVLCDDTNMFTDMDYPADFEKINALAINEPVPALDECREFLRAHQKSHNVIEHCEAVLNTVDTLLNDYSSKLSHLSETDIHRLRCSAILHDIAKGQKFHDREGAAMVRQWGYNQIAALIRHHMNYLPRCNDSFIYPLSPLNIPLSKPEPTVAPLPTSSHLHVSNSVESYTGAPESRDLPPHKAAMSTNSRELNKLSKPSECLKLDGRAILFLADKLVKGAKPVSIEQKFDGSTEKFGDNQQALDAIKSRRNSAELIHRVITG